MNTAHLLLAITAIVWGLLYKVSHRRNRLVVTAPAEDIMLGRLNGFGLSLFGRFRTSQEGQSVYYIFFTVLWMPLIPVGCIVASRGKTEFTGILPGFDTEYSIFGKTKWNGMELLCIYALYWGILFSIILLTSNL